MAKILVLDHELIYRNLCREMFLREGHTVFTLSSGEKLNGVLEKQEPDLAVVDPQLPGEDGFTLIRKIAEKIPVIALTGIMSPEIEKRALDAGARDVLSKTGNLEDLKRTIRQHLTPERFPRLPSPAVSCEKILIVDDEKAIRSLLEIFLKSRGFSPLMAATGEEALEIVRKEHPRMILLDVIMPGMDGILTLKKIRDIDPQAGVVMATGLQDESIIRKAAELGAYASVFKPFDMKYLELILLTRLAMAA